MSALAVYLVLMAHGNMQFLMPMPDIRTCLMNRASALDMLTKDKDVKAQARCFSTAHQAFYPDEPPRPEGEEQVQ